MYARVVTNLKTPRVCFHVVSNQVMAGVWHTWPGLVVFRLVRRRPLYPRSNRNPLRDPVGLGDPVRDPVGFEEIPPAIATLS